MDPQVKPLLTLESLESDFKPSWNVKSGQLKDIIRDTERDMLTAIKKPISHIPFKMAEPYDTSIPNSYSNDTSARDAFRKSHDIWEFHKRVNKQENDNLQNDFNYSMTFSEFAAFLKLNLDNTKKYTYKVIDNPTIPTIPIAVPSASPTHPKQVRLLNIFETSSSTSIPVYSFVIYEDVIDKNVVGDSAQKRRVFLHVTNSTMIESINTYLQGGGRRRSSRKNYKKSPKRVFATKSRRIRRQRK